MILLCFQSFCLVTFSQYLREKKIFLNPAYKRLLSLIINTHKLLSFTSRTINETKFNFQFPLDHALKNCTVYGTNWTYSTLAHLEQTDRSSWKALVYQAKPLFILNYKRLCLSVRLCVCHTILHHHPTLSLVVRIKHLNAPSQCSDSELNI